MNEIDTQINQLESNEIIKINGRKYHFECGNAENVVDMMENVLITLYTYNVYKHLVFGLIKLPVFSYECHDKNKAKLECKEYLKTLLINDGK